MRHIETVIVGGGQAGLATAHHLLRRGRECLVLDAGDRIGDNWHRRWDSLRLFTPARYDGLPGWHFPAPAWSFPTRDAMADYLEAYVERFDVPVRCASHVDRVERNGRGLVVRAGEERFTADNVVVATGAHQHPWVPSFAGELDRAIVQLHSAEYRNPSQLQDGGVLVVGAGNSGADIALELARSQPTWLSGNHPGQVPWRIERRAARPGNLAVFFVFRHLLTERTPPGRKVRAKVRAHHSGPLVRVKLADLEAAGVERVPRTVGADDGSPVVEGGRILDVANVIWCTGFVPDLGWIERPISGDDGYPVHDRGVVGSEPGLYFVGLPFQYSASSPLIGGVGRDAEYVATHIARAASNGGDALRTTPASERSEL
jgi:putative flavoprotein involved in K+ transport